MASLIDYEDMDCKFCGSSGSLVPDGDLNVECTVCGNTYSLDEDEDEDEDEDQDEEENGDDDYYGDYEDEYEDD
jgi:hypothetical protein